MLHQDDHTQLIQRCYSAALIRDAWDGFLELLCRLTGADGAHAILDGVIEVSLGTGPAPHPDGMGLRYNRIYDHSEISHDPLRDYWCRLIKLRSQSGIESVIVLYRAAHRPDFRAVEAQLLDHIAPHVSHAHHMAAMALKDRRRAEHNAALGADLGGSWITCDAQGRVQDASDLARTWAAQREVDLSHGAPLRFGCAEVDQAFQRALSTRDTSSVLEHPSAQMVIAREGERVILRVRHAPRYQRYSARDIAQYFSITPSEARLLQRLCDGMSLAQAGHDLGWTDGSTRSCSKAIYAKLSVSGQAALIQYVYQSALLLGLRAE